MTAPAAGAGGAGARRPLGGLPTAYADGVPNAGPPPPAGVAADPLRFCVFTTVALLAWVLGPVVVAAMAGLGLVAYARAVRGGLTESRCVLRRPRLVLLYLACACAVGAGVVAWHVWRALAGRA
ncbi:hypothetical protein tb265_30020 [Gemmatimonadetes bacterium T265]|nr:hypothetical protein tb265_30020 [Gemmatimonadetes bacterium T265]